MAAPASQRVRRLAAVVSIVAAGLLAPERCLAHAARSTLQTTTYLWLSPSEESIDGVYSIGFGDLPAAALRAEADLDGDGALDPGEVERLGRSVAGRAVECLVAEVSGRPVRLRAVGQEVALDGVAAVAPSWLRVDVHLSAPAPDLVGAPVRLTDRCDWPARGDSEARVEPALGLALDPRDPAPPPPDGGPRPLAAAAEGAVVSFRCRRATEQGAARAAPVAPDPPGPEEGTLAELLRGTEVITLWGLLLALLLGALHALSPGHGKAIVAAYLVGQRGTATHAVLLGLVVTLTHVASVVAIGLVALWLSSHLLPLRLTPYLTAVSGLLIAAIGAGRVRSWVRARSVPSDHDHHHDHHHDHGHGHDHHHDHHHDHEHGRAGQPAGAGRSLPGIVALGLSGGLVPCPSAMVVLLLAVAVGRIAEGMALILAFSVGLAAVLVAVGLLVVHARKLVDRVLPSRRRLSVLPLASGVVVAAVGLAIAARGLLAVVLE